MLIVYALTTGEVRDNHGTNSAYPEGIPDDLAYVNTDFQGISRDSLGLLRLHDEDDAELVQQALANRHHVDPATETVVIDGPYESITTDRDTIPADGSTIATVKYHPGNENDATATFTVNGFEVVDDARGQDGWFGVEVHTSNPGPVEVVAGNRSITITAEEV